MNKLDTLYRIHVLLNQVIIYFSDHGLLSSDFKDRLLNAIEDVLRELESEVAELTLLSDRTTSALSSSGSSSVTHYPENNITSSYPESNPNSYSQRSSSTPSSDENVSPTEFVSFLNCGCGHHNSSCNCQQAKKSGRTRRGTPRRILKDQQYFTRSYIEEEPGDSLTGQLVTTISPNKSNNQTYDREQVYDEVENLGEKRDELDYAMTEDDESADEADEDDESADETNEDDESADETNEDESQALRLDETISSLHSLRLSMRESAVSRSFESKMKKMRDALLVNIRDWNITSKKFKGLPVDEKKEEMVKVLFRSDYGLCFNPNNISRPTSYNNLVNSVFPHSDFPQLNEGKRKEMTIYFARALKSNKYFKEITNCILELHESCKKDDCIAVQ